MDPRRSTPLGRDQTARLLFLALWVAPIGVPLAAAAASPWIADPSRRTPPPVLRQDPAPAPAPADTRVGATGADRPRPRDLIPGAPALRAAGFNAETVRPSAVPQRLFGSHVLRGVEVHADLRLSAGGVTVALAGVAPLDSAAQCRRLDSVVEPCATRALNRLDVLTRGRVVTCVFTADLASNERQAVCRAGKLDLADDLVRNGLARPVAANRL